jgi:hypothetical protein
MINTLVKKHFKSLQLINRCGFMRFSSSNQNPKSKEKGRELLSDPWEGEEKTRGDPRRGKVKKEETYTPEELENIHQEEKVIKIMEISERNFKKIKKYKTLALYFNLPLAIILPILNEFYLAEWSETSSKASLIYHLLFVVDVACFGGAVGGIHGLRNVVILCNYLTKERKVEFTKLDFLRRPYKIVYNPEDLKRVARNPYTPFLSLKHKSKKEDFSMSGIGKWFDVKLFNTIFPLPSQQSNKKRDSDNEDSEKEINKNL